MKNLFYFVSVLTLLASPAMAGTLTCQFSAECFETESCAETSYAFEISFDPAQTSAAEFVTKAMLTDQASTLEVIYAQNGARRFIMSGDSTVGPNAMTYIAPDGDARHVVIGEDDFFIITYHGTCEKAK